MPAMEPDPYRVVTIGGLMLPPVDFTALKEAPARTLLERVGDLEKGLAAEGEVRNIAIKDHEQRIGDLESTVAQLRQQVFGK